MTPRALYVEDDPQVRAFVETLLTGEGFDVEAVDSAEAGAAALARGTFDVLLTDYNLPGHNADWMLGVARDCGLLDRVPVLILTGSDSPSGVEGYRILRKPVDIAVLVSALDEIVGCGSRDVAPSSGEEPPDAPLVLTLYVTGSSRESQKAVRNLQRALKNCDPALYRLVVHDVTSRQLPEGALEDDRVVVTPTLVRASPAPKVWAFGDLSKPGVLEEMCASAWIARPRE